VFRFGVFWVVFFFGCLFVFFFFLFVFFLVVMADFLASLASFCFVLCRDVVWGDAVSLSLLCCPPSLWVLSILLAPLELRGCRVLGEGWPRDGPPQGFCWPFFVLLEFRRPRFFFISIVSGPSSLIFVDFFLVGLIRDFCHVTWVSLSFFFFC